MTICKPTSGQTVSSPVEVAAAATDSLPVKYLQIYVDGIKVYQVYAATLDTNLTLTTGTHRLTVQASDGVTYKSTIYITVQ